MRISALSRLAVLLAIIGISAGCANTIRGVGRDAANTVNAVQGVGQDVSRSAR